MNPLFERLSLQGHLQRIIDQYGQQEGWTIIEQAIERQIGFLDDPRRLKYQFESRRETTPDQEPILHSTIGPHGRSPA